jgi:hypothetical protein
MSSLCPLVVHEEANESVAIWNVFQSARNRNDRRGKTVRPLLVRCARTSGFSEFPFSRKDLSNLRSLDHLSSEELFQFCSARLSSNTYLWPALSTGIFSGFYWIKKPVPSPLHRAAYWIGQEPEESPATLAIRFLREEQESFDQGVTVKGYTGGLEGLSEVVEDTPVVLEIQLSFFSASVLKTFQRNRLALTHSAADRFEENPYHILRLLSGDKVSLDRSGSVPELVFHQFDFKPHEYLRQSGDEIERRITLCIEAIAPIASRVEFVTISRGLKSGRIPADQWRGIEKRVLEGLQQVLNIDVFQLKEYLSL